METENEKVKNVIRDTRRKIKYNIYASKELTREQMLAEVKEYNHNPLHYRLKPGTVVEIQSSL